MSHFTHYQVRRFRFVFNQYAEGGKTTAIVSQCAHNEPIDNPPDEETTDWLLKVIFKLTAKELQELMPRLGPPITIQQARDFIYEYDSSCTGCLDFDDFIEFLGDYQAILQIRREKALDYYTERRDIAQTCTTVNGNEYPWNAGDNPAHDEAKVVVARHFINRYPEAFNYLATLYLDDPEFFFTKESESVTNHIQETGLVEDMNLLKRSIVVRIYSARNLQALARLKQRAKKGIDFASLNPMIRIELCGIIRQTSALLATTTPDWDQDLQFDILIPPGEIHDIQQWVNRQVMTISLLDFEDMGNSQHTETLAASSLPLVKILMSAKKPMFQVTKLNPFDCVTDIEQVPCLELSISDNTRELFAWAKVMDAYNTPEDVWFEVHRQKLLNDLKGAAAGRFCLDSNQKTDTPYIDLWQQYCLVTQPLYVPFRRRDYQTFTLDEYNRFIPLNSLIKPMRIPTIQTPTEAATEVARIPYYCSITDRSRQTEELISFLLNDKQEETLIRADQSMEKRTLCGWNNQYSWTVAATYNLYAQVSTPHTMIIQRRGTLLEHAVFLCNLLLGIGIPSFVALGKVKQRPYAWVVTIIHPEQDLFSEREDVDMFRSCTISYSNVDGEQIGYQRSQFRQAVAAARAQEGNRTVQVIHWDPVTGMNFSKPSQLGFNFERVEVVFDASNIFYNVQKSDSLLRPFFSWDLNDLTHWIPFYSEDLKATDPLQCVYPATITMLNTAPQLPLRLQDDRFLPALASAMQQYRRHILFLPETYFHRNASKLLQMHLNRFEMAFMEKMESGLLWKGGAMQVLSRRSSWQSEYRGSQFHLFNETRRDEIGNRGLLRAVHAEVEREFTPDRHFFRLTVLRFKDADMDVVMDHLATLGLLDQSAPGTVFTIAARVFQHAFSRSSWIAVGHFSDLIGGEVHHLLNPISYFDFETDFGASSLRDRAQGGENSYDQEKAGEVSTE